MQTSPEIKNLTAALLGFHHDIGKISKDATNPFFKSKYASLSQILDAIKEPLYNNGLIIMQFPEDTNGLTTRLIYADTGEWMEATYFMKPVKDTPQDAGSAITYARRYAIGAILSLNIEADDDGNAASGRTDNSKPYAKKQADQIPAEQESPTISAAQDAEIRQLLESPDLADAVKNTVFQKMGAFTNSEATAAISKLRKMIAK